MSKTYIYILNDTAVSLWGLSGKERLQRMLKKYADVEIIEDLPSLSIDLKILLLRADFLFDSRLFEPMFALQEGRAITASHIEEIVAVVTSTEFVEQIVGELLGQTERERLGKISLQGPAKLVNAYDTRLLKYDPAEILAINDENKAFLENEIFDGSYKGITDFVTKWLWPLPARAAVKVCVQNMISPNQVTILSIFLAIFAGLAFWGGYLLTGLLLGWVMTFLDTVDGKLARVTVSSSKMGDILDHGLDLVHPPLWYLAWGLGISGAFISDTTATNLFWIIFIAYIGGRFCEGAFELWVAKFRLFLWTPLDSYNRLITARRNPNLVLLTFSLILGRPDIGLYAVVIWHVLSTMFLLLRVIQAFKEKKRVGELSTWLNKIDPVKDRGRLEVRIFTRLSKSSRESS
jgi:phosphatidylglycerophosphate synthase